LEDPDVALTLTQTTSSASNLDMVEGRQIGERQEYTGTSRLIEWEEIRDIYERIALRPKECRLS